jgi:long-chain acyl-CoA synthetase
MEYLNCNIEKTRNSKTVDRRVYKSRKINNFRELVFYSINNYENNIAYKYKNKPSDTEIITKTYKEAGEDIKAFGTALLNRDAKKVAVIGKNRYEWCITYLATTTSGLVIVPLDKLLPEIEIENLIKRSEADIIVCDEKYLEKIKDLKNSNSTNLKTIICMDKVTDKDIEYFYDVKNEGQKQIEMKDTKYDNISIDENKMAVLLFTSGTTSEPKGVMLSQKNICVNIEDMATYSKMYSTDTILSVLPLHHTFECTISFLYGFYSGVCIAFCDGLKYYAQNLKEYNVTIIVAVPALLEVIYKKIKKGIEESGQKEKFEKGVKISEFLLKLHIDLRKKIFKAVRKNLGENIRIIYYGAAQMEKETIKGYYNIGIDSVQGYGLTETSPILTAETDKYHKSGTVGICFPALEMKIINKNEDGAGEICAKGASIMLGYYKNDELTKKAIDEEGWFKTGDYGYFDEEGFLHLTGRKADIIVLKNGKNVYPDEIEGLINKLPYIKESMVFARNKTKTDTLLEAKIVYDEKELKKEFSNIDLNDKNSIEEKIMKDIKEKVNVNLANYKHVKKILLTTEEMEKTTTSKIKRNIEMQKINQK